MQIAPLDLRNGSAGSGWRVKRLIAIVALSMTFYLHSGAAWAVSEEGDPPIYNPASKSYFQLLKGTGKHNFWQEAHEQARTQVFKGARGRLAVVDHEETHKFIMKNFDTSKEMWIGLRYWCEFRLLEWVGLRPYSPTDPEYFQNWHNQWSRNGQACPANATGPGAFMGVYYQPLGSGSARWQAVRGGKGFGRLLVEYPTGEE